MVHRRQGLGNESELEITTQAELRGGVSDTAASTPQLSQADREKILTFPGEDATDEERQQHGELVSAAAVNTNLLDITDCTPNPLVIEVGYGESIEVKNSGETGGTLFFAGNSVTIPAGTSRGLVVTEFVGIKGGDGVAGYGCNGEGGIFYINSNLTVKPSEKQRYVTFKLIEFLYPDGRSGPGIEGVEVTFLNGSGETRKTASDGSVTFKGDLPLTVQLEKEDYITEVTVREEGEEIVLPDWQGAISLSPGGYEIVECGSFTDRFTQVEPIGCDGQRITGHRVMGGLDQWNQWTVAIEFYTDQPTPKPLFGFMPRAVINGNVDIVDMFCVHWRDEVEVNLKSALAGNRNGLLEWQRSSHIDLELDDRLVMVYRPYNTVHGQNGQHSVREMNLHLALVDYLNQEFKVKLFNLYGGSADGVVAIAVAQHRPELVATVGLSAPSLSVNTWDGYNEIGPTAPWVYDPWDYVENLPPNLPILTVYDLKDKVVPNEGILPFFEKAGKLNLPLVKLVLIDSDDQRYHHGDMVQLFENLTRPENKNFHPAR